MRIGVFDSGLGGLSVLRFLRAQIPEAEYIYVADSQYAPYGDRSPSWIKRRSLQIAAYLEQQGATAILIACNTATAYAADEIRAQTKLPVIAMEPAIKPAVSKTKTGKIAVLATSNTLASQRFKRLKCTLDTDYQYIELACHDWVEAVENALDDEQKRALVETQLQPLIENQVDTYVLACTHFPFLESQLRDVLPAKSYLIDPSLAVAKEVKRRLDYQARSAGGIGRCVVYSSGSLVKTAALLKTLIQFSVELQPLPVLGDIDRIDC